MTNNRRNNELTKVIQAIRDMTTTLLRNQRLKELTEVQSFIKFKRNKPSQFSKCYNSKEVKLWIKEMEKYFKL